MKEIGQSLSEIIRKTSEGIQGHQKDYYWG